MDKKKIGKKNRLMQYGVLIVALIIMVSSIGYAVTRTISSSGDNIKTFIYTSNGNYFEAVGSNIIVAVEDIGLSDGEVWIPDGVFYVDEEIDLSSGFGRIIIHLSAGSVIKMAGSFTGNRLIRLGENITICGSGLIDGNGSSIDVAIQMGKNSLLKDFRITNFVNETVRSDTTGWSIDGVMFYDVAESIVTFGGSNNTVVNCIFENNTYRSITLSVGKYIIKDNIFIDSEEIYISNSVDGSYIGNNVFRYGPDDSIYIRGDNVTVESNIFYMTTDDAINIQPDAEYCKILNNYFFDVGGENIYDQTGRDNHNIIRLNDGFQDSIYPIYEQTTAPTVQTNSTVYWYDTDDGYFYQIFKVYGTTYYINMTTTI